LQDTLSNLYGPGLGSGFSSQGAYLLWQAKWFPESAKTQSRGTAAPTDQEYKACVDQAKSQRDRAVKVARAEQVAGGIAIIIALGANAEMIAALNKAFFAHGLEGNLDLMHLGGFAYAGSLASFAPGGAYVKATFFDLPNAENTYNSNLIHCAAPVNHP
jgi:hypothetical protein